MILAGQAVTTHDSILTNTQPDVIMYLMAINRDFSGQGANFNRQKVGLQDEHQGHDDRHICAMPIRRTAWA